MYDVIVVFAADRPNSYLRSRRRQCAMQPETGVSSTSTTKQYGYHKKPKYKKERGEPERVLIGNTSIGNPPTPTPTPAHAHTHTHYRRGVAPHQVCRDDALCYPMYADVRDSDDVTTKGSNHGKVQDPNHQPPRPGCCALRAAAANVVLQHFALLLPALCWRWCPWVRVLG